MDGLDWTGLDWMDPAEKPSPLRAPAVLKMVNMIMEYSETWKLDDILKYFRNFALIHDSYNCGKGPRMGRMRPWPTQREGFLYVGYDSELLFFS